MSSRVVFITKQGLGYSNLGVFEFQGVAVAVTCKVLTEALERYRTPHGPYNPFSGFTGVRFRG